MTNQEMFLKRLTLLNIPLSLEGKELPSELKAKIMLMRVAYDKAAKAFDDDMQQVLKEIKKEGYDERAQKINHMKEIDGKEDATKEEKKEADEIRKTEEDFNKETEELNKAYSEAYRLALFFFLNISMDNSLVILPRYVERTLGLCGGMEFHALRYVSLTHSLLSSKSERILKATFDR